MNIATAGLIAALGLSQTSTAAPPAAPSTTTAKTTTTASAEIFLLPIRVDDDRLGPLARALERRLGQSLSAQGHATMTSQDLAGLLDLAAARQNAGCDDDDACAAELAGSIGAERVLVATLTRIDERYRLDLALSDRDAARVLGRARATGRDADELEADVDTAVADLFGTTPPSTGPSPVLIGGAVGIGVGVVTAGIGGVLGVQVLIARGALDDSGADFERDPSAAGVRALGDAWTDHEAARQTWNTLGLPLVAAGAAVAVAGGVALAVGISE